MAGSRLAVRCPGLSVAPPTARHIALRTGPGFSPISAWGAPRVCPGRRRPKTPSSQWHGTARSRHASMRASIAKLNVARDDKHWRGAERGPEHARHVTSVRRRAAGLAGTSRAAVDPLPRSRPAPVCRHREPAAAELASRSTAERHKCQRGHHLLSGLTAFVGRGGGAVLILPAPGSAVPLAPVRAVQAPHFGRTLLRLRFSLARHLTSRAIWPRRQYLVVSNTPSQRRGGSRRRMRRGQGRLSPRCYSPRSGTYALG